MKKISFTLLALIALFSASAQHRSTFDDLGLPPASYWNGSNLSGGFLDGDAYFTTFYDTSYGGYWSSGFAYSDIPVNVDTLTALSNDFHYEFNVAPGAGVLGSATFGIYYGGGNIRLKGFAAGHQVYGMYVTNTAFDYLSMKFGDHFAKKFGGTTGTDPDWFRLTVSGWYQGALLTDSIQFYLADFRSADTAQHYILKNWKFMNLLSLGNVDSLFFAFSSSDTGVNGLNTPAYFALDNFMTTDGAAYVGPNAVNDSFSIVYMDTLTGNADTLHANILANDSLPGFLGSTVSLITGPLITGARAYLDSNDHLVYIPAAGIQATDSLTYAICDEAGTCDTAYILIFVAGPRYSGLADLGLSELTIYPNPARSIISVSYSSTIETVSIIDITGRQVLQQDINKATAAVNIGALSPGVYTVLVHTIDGTAVRRLIKE
jgi:hypothetical protein